MVCLIALLLAIRSLALAQEELLGGSATSRRRSTRGGLCSPEYAGRATDTGGCKPVLREPVTRKPPTAPSNVSLHYARRSVDCSLQAHKGEKAAEIDLRELIRRMKDILQTLDSEDRPHLTRSSERVGKAARPTAARDYLALPLAARRRRSREDSCSDPSCRPLRWLRRHRCTTTR